MAHPVDYTYARWLRTYQWLTGLALPLLLIACQGRPFPSRTEGPCVASVRHAASSGGQAMPGISGLTWAGADTFLAIHDAKYPAEASAPRVSLFTRSASGRGWTWTPLNVDWPAEEGPSSDLESGARIPGTSHFLLVESGGGQKPMSHVYLAHRQGTTLHVRAAAAWPVPVTNVEGSTVARLDDQLVFLYAERSAGQDSTALAWSLLSADALRAGQLQWGPFRHVAIPNLAPAGAGARAASDLAIDAAGRIYMTTTYDPSDDYGPFQSSVWSVGHLSHDDTGVPTVLLASPPCRRATLDGLKVEGLAVRHGSSAGLSNRSGTDVFIGTDDEHLGAVLRPLPAASCPP